MVDIIILLSSSVDIKQRQKKVPKAELELSKEIVSKIYPSNRLVRFCIRIQAKILFYPIGDG